MASTKQKYYLITIDPESEEVTVSEHSTKKEATEEIKIISEEWNSFDNNIEPINKIIDGETFMVANEMMLINGTLKTVKVEQAKTIVEID